MNKVIRKITVYRLAIMLGILFSINALSSAIMASFLNVEWDQLSATSKFLIVVAIIQNWTGTMLAFMNKTLARIEQGQDPILPPNEQPQPIKQNEKTDSPTPAGS